MLVVEIGEAVENAEKISNRLIKIIKLEWNV